MTTEWICTGQNNRAMCCIAGGRQGLVARTTPSKCTTAQGACNDIASSCADFQAQGHGVQAAHPSARTTYAHVAPHAAETNHALQPANASVKSRTWPTWPRVCSTSRPTPASEAFISACGSWEGGAGTETFSAGRVRHVQPTAQPARPSSLPVKGKVFATSEIFTESSSSTAAETANSRPPAPPASPPAARRISCRFTTSRVGLPQAAIRQLENSRKQQRSAPAPPASPPAAA